MWRPGGQHSSGPALVIPKSEKYCLENCLLTQCLLSLKVKNPMVQFSRERSESEASQDSGGIASNPLGNISEKCPSDVCLLLLSHLLPCDLLLPKERQSPL